MVPVNLKQKDFTKYLFLMCTTSQIQSNPCITLSLMEETTLFWFPFLFLKLLLNKMFNNQCVDGILFMCVCLRERQSIHLYMYIYANTHR